jgi:hypothetical protein
LPEVIDFLHWKQATKDPWQHKEKLSKLGKPHIHPEKIHDLLGYFQVVP